MMLRLGIVLWAVCGLPYACSLHHMEKRIPQLARRDDPSIPMLVTNRCKNDIHPGVTTQAGQGPKDSGFRLGPGDQRNLSVSSNWQGRIWGRTNCSFNHDGTAPASNGGHGVGRACSTGDCNGILNCKVTGLTPVTLAEFTLDGGDGQTYYDISLVDGYNIPMAIVMNPRGNRTLTDIPPNLTNPSCQGTAGLLESTTYNPYSGLSNGQNFLGTNSSFPLPFDAQASQSQVQRWCPWDLQVTPPNKPGDGVYPYPDDNIQRPAFNPCFSACAKWNKPSDCCTGDHNSPKKCSPSLYSKAAKRVCPDAYSFAFDDQKSTFIIPIGAGFEVVFCPGARSTNIISKKPAAEKLLREKGGSVSSLNLTALPSKGSLTDVTYGTLILLLLLAVTFVVFV